MPPNPKYISTQAIPQGYTIFNLTLVNENFCPHILYSILVQEETQKIECMYINILTEKIYFLNTKGQRFFIYCIF